MEYCGNIISNAVVRRRGEQVIGVLVIMILMVSVVVSTPSIPLRDAQVACENMLYKPMGEEIVPFVSGIHVPKDIIEGIVAETNMMADVVVKESSPDITDIEISVPENVVSSEILIVPEVTIVQELPVVSETPIVQETPIVPEAPIVSETPVLPDQPADVAPPITVVPPEVEVPPDTVVPPNTILPPQISPTAGFLINDNGMIYGLTEEVHSMISNRILELPSEGCHGVTQNSFYEMNEVVCEIMLPANMVNLESGVFCSLPDLAWIEVAEDNPVYTSLDGILFDKTMATLIAVPSGRTGGVEIPETVTELGAYSLANLQATAIDLRRCGLVDVSDMVFGNTDPNGLIIFAPEQYLGKYEEIFGGMGAIVKVGWKDGV